MHVFTILAGLLSVGTMLELLRRRSLKEKYAVLWVLVGVVMLVVAVWPPLLDGLAHLTGVKSGPTLLLSGAVLLLILVCVQLSAEASRVEDRCRALAEEIGLLRLQVDDLGGGRARGAGGRGRAAAQPGSRPTTTNSL